VDVEAHGLHPGLELRLQILAERISRLRSMMRDARGLEKIEMLGEVRELERRYARLERRLQVLNRERPGFRHRIRVALARAADDLAATLGDFMLRLDSHPQGQAPLPTDEHASKTLSC
jgi:hypothetical protein